MLKQFFYNILVSKEDLADRDEDIRALLKMFRSNKKVVLYAPRRYGKSSLASVILPNEWVSKESAHVYADFMGCSSLESVTARLSEAYAKCLQNYFKKEFLLKGTLSFLKNMSLVFSPDPGSGEISFELSSKKGNTPSLTELLESLIQLSQHKKVFIALKDFLSVAQLGASTSQKIGKKLYHLGFVEEEIKGYRLSNPLLSFFLKHRAV